jgi:NAD(P)-dependent dehydrogenase (short-subunit alcohol dehydrogenase family)
MEQKKVAVILGVGPGLGAAVSHRFAREGFAVGLMARNKDKLVTTQKEIETAGGKALSISTDATDSESVKSAFDEVREKLGNVEVFIYNAGTFRKGGILEVTPEEFEGSWKINCLGALLGAQQVLPMMLNQGRGTIILTGATGSIRGGAYFSCLAVGKFGLRALAQSIAREFGPKGIHVAHVIIDGQIGTPRQQAMEPKREAHTFLSPEAIAESYWQLYIQDPTAWTLELDLRPSVEKF